MKLRFRVWMPLAAVMLVLLSIAALLIYVLPATKARLSEYAKDRAVAQAFAAADVVSTFLGGDGSREDLLGSEDETGLENELELVAGTDDGEVLVVDRQGEVAARAGRSILSPPPEDLLRRVSEGERINERIGEQRVAAVPLTRNGSIDGGVVFVPGDHEDALFELFLRSGVEGASIAAVIGGGLALLLAAIFSRRVERLTSSARAMGGGDLSDRIDPGFDDELGELAKTFNTMAGRLEDSFLQLEEKGATLNAILNNLTEGVLATDLSGNVMFANRCARAMLGLNEEGPLGELPDRFEDFDLPEAVDRCARKEECGEARVRDGDEGFLQIRLNHTPAFDNHEGGVLVVIQDLSEGRRLEANQQRFLANAAHELRTPITAILGASELLLTEGEEEDPEVKRRFLSHVHTEAKRMQRLSDTLLRLARTGTDQRDPEIMPIDLYAAAYEAAERMGPLAESAGLKLRVLGGPEEDPEGGPGRDGRRVRADREWLGQTLLVVLGNAVKHSGRDGEVRLRVREGAVVVEDDGEGINEADLPYVFERFYRGKKRPAEGGAAAGGFGLGLAICKDLVERMDGSIVLESEEGVGTRVEIKLPEEDDA